jgi:four helix bundle protein
MDKKINTHRDLIVYKKSILFVSEIYRITLQFPEAEKFGLVSQLRRASVSIPVNIAEGSGRKSSKELQHFLNISMGSISEVETLLEISKNLNILDNEKFADMGFKLSELRKMTSALIKSLNKTPQTCRCLKYVDHKNG